MKTIVIKSKKRERTASARLVNIGDSKLLKILVPWWLDETKTEKIVAGFKKKLQKRKLRSSNIFLKKRSNFLLKKYLPGKEVDFNIFWSKKLTKSFGICYPRKKEIKISSRTKKMPLWVLDYLIFHELVHLKIPRHNQKFWQAVKKYPKAEKAKGFLQGVDWIQK